MRMNEPEGMMIFVMRITCTKYEGEPYTWHVVSEFGDNEGFYCPNCDASRRSVHDVDGDEHHVLERLGHVTLVDILEKVRTEIDDE